ncbi:MAG: hypothetical protein JWO90_2519 [Solirubrobacterales bacterium]|jgi:hypothetical protein|nr:hypothetical protein [Solirubrobacterales bacterium]
MPTTVTVKKSCCKDKPRCKKCPVVLKRLADAGLAERRDKRTYVVSDAVRKKDLKAARSPQLRAAR